MRTKYRIVSDNYLGYQVQFKLWWLPFIWFEAHGRAYGTSWGINTFWTIEDAEKFIQTRNVKRKVYSETI